MPESRDNIKPFLVNLVVNSPANNADVTVPFDSTGFATPQSPATRVGAMGWDVDDGQGQMVPPATFPTSLNHFAFTFRVTKTQCPTTGFHILSIHTFDDAGDITESHIQINVTSVT
jgi:hypothetical protein